MDVAYVEPECHKAGCRITSVWDEGGVVIGKPTVSLFDTKVTVE